MCNVLIINVLHTPNTPFNYFEASHIDLSSGIFNFLFFSIFSIFVSCTMHNPSFFCYYPMGK